MIGREPARATCEEGSGGVGPHSCDTATLVTKSDNYIWAAPTIFPNVARDYLAATERECGS